MGLETGTYIDSLNASNPVGASDPKSQGDDHIRLLKSTILATFPNVSGAVSLTHAQLNDAARLTATNVFTVAQSIQAASVQLRLLETGAASDAGNWEFRADGGVLNLYTLNDSLAASSTPMAITRSGTSVSTIDLVASNIRIRTGSGFQVFDSGNTDSIKISHDGTNAIIAGTLTTDLYVQGITNLRLRGGSGLAINTDDNATTALLIDPATVSGGVSTVSTTGQTYWQGGNFNLRGGVLMRLYDSTNTDYISFQHNGTDVKVTCVTTDDIDMTGFTYLNLQTGARLRVWDTSNADYIQISHDGTNAIIGTSGAAVITLDVPVSSPNTSAAEWGYKGAPHNEQNGDYTLVLTDAGKRIYKASGGAGETITIPANASVAFPVGTIIEILNDGGGNLSIAITTDTLEELATGNTGTRTLPDNNKAIIEKVTSTLWKYSATA